MNKELVSRKLESIASCIYDKMQSCEDEKLFGIYNGNFGTLLLILYYANYSKEQKFVVLAEKYAEILLLRLPKELGIHTFCSGLSGILYLFEFLREQDMIDIDISEYEREFEYYLIKEMKKDMYKTNYDFMHGAIGVGLYFLKKGANKQTICDLVDFLYNTAEKDPVKKIFKWKSIIDHENQIEGYNIALSHGISSIILFLCRVVKSGIISEKIEEMLEGSVNYILSQHLDFSKWGCHFPSQSLENNSPLSRSRLAWCYGDLGVAISLWQAGKLLKNPSWKEKAMGVLRDSTRRLSLSENYVQDAGICHGSAGIAMIYRRLYHDTQEDDFAKASEYWLSQTLNLSRYDDGLAGYKTKYGDEWIQDYTILTGISGIGLVLLSFLGDDKQEWDELFLLH